MAFSTMCLNSLGGSIYGSWFSQDTWGTVELGNKELFGCSKIVP